MRTLCGTILAAAAAFSAAVAADRQSDAARMGATAMSAVLTLDTALPQTLHDKERIK